MTLGPDHERWEDAAGAYALNAMPEDECRAFEAHLAECPACRAEAAELRVAAHALPLSAPALLPPPALKARIMAEVEREAALLASASSAPRTEPEKSKRRWSFPRLSAPVMAFACAALIAGVVVGGILFSGGGDGRKVPFESTLPQASAELDVRDDGGATVVANNLPQPDPGKVYMVWIQRPGHAPEPTSALFTPRRDGSATASVTGDLDGVETVLINTEPLGGSTTPTSTPFLVADLT
ncbi:anti-sigma factor [Solirubrobacter taibaiensis]|nr:anti-sigma factor [Solirubrobacter taibaiensis]